MRVRRWAVVAAAMCGTQGFAQTTAFQDDVALAGPVLWYQFNEASGNLVNHGSLGSGFDAVETGSATRQVPAISGDEAIGFARGDWFESMGVSSLTGNPSFSVEAIIRLDSGGTAGTYGPFLHWGDGSPGSRTGKEVYFSVQHVNNDRLYAGFYNAGVRMVSSVAQDAWLHYVWVREGGNDSDEGSTLYINGVEVPSELDPVLSPGFVAAANIAVAPSAYRINRAQDFGDNRFFTGAIDELALYDRLLTAEEITRRAQLISCPGDLADASGLSGFDGQISFGDFFALSFLAGPCGSGTANPGCIGDIADSTGFGPPDGVIDFGDFFALSFLSGPCP